ncbi:dicarboxylate/amino acid:cation symporter [Magnetospirillum sulfuroxidans]|uniref:Cation:dicarboxylase symporter family transporter n=1 Tax=Magnetospirillum sulfuroxidans TaxID=611300 RepID=A0ABS5IHS3_9PROT|nr:cation:dicarboxylase symporter family transporter [Magnetospirillum sulfuroxidans]MBR9973313.1 cation:dicarboxylase symporter family transporter [Magnetospirillum sulfuroxidans]
MNPVLLRWLTSPWAVLGGLSAGAVLGILVPAAGAALAPFGELYLSLMQMCVLPIIVTAISTSIARLLISDSANALPRLALLFIAGMALTALLSLTVAVVVEPGIGLAINQKVFLAQEMLRQEAQSAGGPQPSLWLLVQMIVPTNIVRAAAEGHTLALLLFSLLLGLGLGKLGNEQGGQAIGVLDAFYNALVKVMGWIQVGLPFGLLALMANHAAQGGSDMFIALGRLIATIYALVIGMIMVLTLVISARTGIRPLTVLAKVREPLFTAFGTASSIASLPTALRAVELKLGLGRQAAQMVLPLGVSLYPLGNVLHVVISSVFVLQLYGLPIGIDAALLVMVGGILVACAMTGAPGIASMTLLAVLLSPFGVPVEVAIVLLIALEPVLDPPLTLLNVYGNIAAAAILGGKRTGLIATPAA